MKTIKTIKEALTICKAMGSDVRADILQLLYENERLNLDSIAKMLHLTNGALTKHIKLLHSSGLIEITSTPGIHGTNKECSLSIGQILFDIQKTNLESFTEYELSVGQYTSYSIAKKCGIARPDGFIGTVNNAGSFDLPERFNAQYLYFDNGYVEYTIPNTLRENQECLEIQIIAELATGDSTALNYVESDISFSLNDLSFPKVTLVDERKSRKGIFSPSWLPSTVSQSGKLTTFTLNTSGFYINNEQKSAQTIRHLRLNYKSKITFRLSCLLSAENNGGLAIFGSGFGDYSKGILIRTKIIDLK